MPSKAIWTTRPTSSFVGSTPTATWCSAAPWTTTTWAEGRGGIPAALGAVQAAPTVITIDSDRLYPPNLQTELVQFLPGRPDHHVVHSALGHDGFLVETAQIGPLVTAALDR